MNEPIPSFDECFKKYFPADTKIFSMQIAVAHLPYSLEEFTRILAHSRAVDGAISHLDCGLNKPYLGSMVMHVAYGSFKGDLDILLKEFNGSPDFNSEMRRIYAACHT